MNDFEIQRRLRELRVVREPGRDLWPDIRVRLRTVQSAARTRARPRRWLPLSAAAMFAVATTTGLFAIAVQRQGAQPTAPDRAAVSVREQIERARDLLTAEYHPQISRGVEERGDDRACSPARLRVPPLLAVAQVPAVEVTQILSGLERRHLD